jgi:hypothetical protein
MGTNGQKSQDWSPEGEITKDMMKFRCDEFPSFAHPTKRRYSRFDLFKVEGSLVLSQHSEHSVNM